MHISRCHELLKFNSANIFLLAFAVHGEQVYLILQHDVINYSVALWRPSFYSRVAHRRFVHSSADVWHDNSRALAFF